MFDSFYYICRMRLVDSTDFIKKLISEGEHVNQDFKFEISDARKIARSLSAFANTSGGRLLIGVKDNGRIAGVKSEEEAYMIDAAANVYCSPAPVVEMTTYQAEGKTVLVATVESADRKPVFAIDSDGKKIAFVRIADENIVASPVHLSIWRQEQSAKGAIVRLDGAEELLMGMLRHDETVDIRSFTKLAGIKRYEAIRIIAKFVRFGVLEEVFAEHRFCWRRTYSDIEF